MDLLVTEFKKGEKLLKKTFRKEITAKGCRKIFTEKSLMAVLATGSCPYFDNLDKAGKHFRKSWRTRYTSHKANDFSSIQAKSSLDLQKFYQNIMNISKKPTKPILPTLEEYVDLDDMDLDLGGGLQSQLETLNKKIQKEIEAVRRMVNRVPSMKDKPIKQQLQSIEGTPLEKDYQHNLDRILGEFDNSVQFTDKDKKVIPSKTVKNLFDAGFYSSLPLGAAGGITSALLLTGVIGGATAGIGVAVGLGCGLVVVAALGIGSLACANSKRMQEIDAKKYQGQMYDHMRKIVKYTNQANRAVQEYNQERIGEDDDQPITITPAHRECAKEFIKSQNLLWKKYATPAGRKYTLGAKDDKHTSGLIKRSDTRKNDSLQKAKLAIANTWANMQIRV